jgi:hypothetical protein
MTNFEYLNIPKRKTIENATIKEIKIDQKRKIKACDSRNNKIGFYNKTNNPKNC